MISKKNLQNTRSFLSILIFMTFNNCFSQKINLQEKSFSEIFFGKTINDPYRYMENAKDTLVQKWFKQNSIDSKLILENISNRKQIVDKLIEFDKRGSFSITKLNYLGTFCFYLKKKDTDKSSRLYYKSSEKGEEIMLYDPINYKKELGEEYNINYIKPSWDNKTIALGLSKNGEEIGEIAFLDIESKTLYPEVIKNCWPADLGGLNWLKDNSGIIYINIPVIDKQDKNYILNTESVIYKLRDNPLNYKSIFSKHSNPELIIDSADFPFIDKFDTNDKYILGYLGGVSSYTDNYYAKIEELYNDKINWQPLFKKEDCLKSALFFNDYVYCLSSRNSPNYKIIKSKIVNSDFNNAEVVVAENKEESINDYVITSDGLFYTTTKNGVESKLYYVDNNKLIKRIELPVMAGTIQLETKDKSSPELWVTISGWLNAVERYKYNVLKNEFLKDNISPSVQYPEFKDFIVEEIEVPSHDETLVPVSIIYNKRLKKNKKNNVLIDAYGSYGISKTPKFIKIYLTWVLNGGIYVVPHVRGGGEKGDNWHKGGFKTTKPNTWKDLIATAEYLIKENITSDKKIAVYGRSAGGITVGRAVTERPDLFKVMLCENGDLNISRIESVFNGPNSMKEFGNPDIKEEFNALNEMDAYQHIKEGDAYPATLISVGMNDARVAPWMSSKFVAKLQAATASKNPILFKVDFDAGHGIDNSSIKLYNDFADQFAFAFWQLGHSKFKLKK